MIKTHRSITDIFRICFRYLKRSRILVYVLKCWIQSLYLLILTIQIYHQKHCKIDDQPVAYHVISHSISCRQQFLTCVIMVSFVPCEILKLNNRHKAWWCNGSQKNSENNQNCSKKRNYRPLSQVSDGWTHFPNRPSRRRACKMRLLQPRVRPVEQ